MAKRYLDELQTYVDQIVTRMYHDFTIDKKYFCGDFIFKKEN